MTRVGFIGTGRMGAPMVRRLVDAGHEVTALGRSAEKCDALRELGAHPATTASEVVASAEIVIVCVFTDDQVQQVCLESGLLTAMQPGSVLVLHTTGSPRTAETLATSAKAHGIDVIDAPVSGGPHDIAAGTITLFVGGGEDAVAKSSPVLSSYSEPILHVGPVGSGQRVKLINNALFAAQLGLVTEAVALGDQLGITESALLNALPQGSGSSRAMGNIATAGSAQNFLTAVSDFIGKDVAVLRETVRELGGDLGKIDDLINAALRV